LLRLGRLSKTLYVLIQHGFCTAVPRISTLLRFPDYRSFFMQIHWLRLDGSDLPTIVPLSKASMAATPLNLITIHYNSKEVQPNASTY
jgi:hypothetical protein